MGAVSLQTPPAIIIFIILLFIIGLMVSVLIGSTLSSIFVAAVYQYAADGNAGAFFDASLVQRAFRPSLK